MNYVANTWFLLVLFVLFVGLVFWVFRRDSSKKHEEHGKIPFKQHVHAKEKERE